MGQFWTFLAHLNTLAGPTIMLLYPLYASVCAIESPTKVDDEQWLAYWILYSFLTLLEMVAEPILYWIPIWYQIKVALIAWLVLPQFKGAAFIYDRFVRQQLDKHKSNSNNNIINNSGVVETKGSSPPPLIKTKKRFMSFVKSKKFDKEAY